jgi:hypothetical protein
MLDTSCLRLLLANWEDPGGPLRLSESLTLADLAGAVFFANARLFLAALAEDDGVPATASANLNRAFVGRMFSEMVFPQVHRESLLRVSKVINEQDVWPLHLVRVICQCAGAVALRKKRFRLTKAGRALLPDDRAGALYRRLFLAYFRKFDLLYDFRFREAPGIQHTMAVILWRLDTVARGWAPVQGLAPNVLLPGVLEQMRQAMVSPYDKEEWILAGYVLNPLLRLGLIERRKGGEGSHVTEEDSIRVTALWRKFIGFAWNGGAR